MCGRAADVAERGQLLQRLVIETGFLRGRRVAGALVARSLQLVLHLARHTAIALHDVLQLTRILAQLVQLGPGGVDELVVVGTQAVKRRPSVLEIRRHRLAVRVAHGSFTAGQQRQQRQSLNALRFLAAHQIENGRRNVDRAHLRRDSFPALASRDAHEQRDVNGIVVDVVPVLLLAVLAEAFAVIADDDDDRLLDGSTSLHQSWPFRDSAKCCSSWRARRAVAQPAQPVGRNGVPNEIRTRVGAVKGRCPRPLDDGDGMRRSGAAPGGRCREERRTLARPS